MRPREAQVSARGTRKEWPLEGCCLLRVVVVAGLPLCALALQCTAPFEAAEPTEGRERVVKAAFTLRRRIPFRAGQSLTAERVFDSFVDPLPIGIRGSVASPRQLLYGAGDFLIDLRIEEGVRAPGTITGQVVNEPESFFYKVVAEVVREFPTARKNISIAMMVGPRP